ncbi:SCFD1 isoform 20, partial [Pongo abelii]
AFTKMASAPASYGSTTTKPMGSDTHGSRNSQDPSV